MRSRAVQEAGDADVTQEAGLGETGYGLGANAADFDNPGDLVQIDEVHGGRGYQSHHGMLFHLGLCGNEQVDRVEVRWIGRTAEVFENLQVDERVTLREGTGRSGD